MGLIRETIKSAFDNGQPNNGLNQRSIPFGGSKKSVTTSSRLHSSIYHRPPGSRYPQQPLVQSTHHLDSSQYKYTYEKSAYSKDEHDVGRHSAALYHEQPPSYGYSTRDDEGSREISKSFLRPSGRSEAPRSDYSHQKSYNNEDFENRCASPQDPYFPYHTEKECNRPLVLPQIEYGKGQPFLRGYSDELARFGLHIQELMAIVDAINVAIVPNPENQIFQKGANIAGWFVPGSAYIGLVAGQVVTGVGAAYGKANSLCKILHEANMEVFLPKGLEVCVCSTQNIEAELGIPSAYTSYYPPLEKMKVYGDLVAPLTQVLEPNTRGGRNDPVALLARGMSSRDRQKALGDARKNAAKGDQKKMNSLGNDLKWLMVKTATPAALHHLQKPGGDA